MYNTLSACFTGHRNITENPKDVFSKLEAVLQTIIENNNVTDFYAGGAVGFDTIAAKVVLYMRDTKKLPVKLHLILPCPKDQQTRDWTVEQRYEYDVILKRVNTVEYTSNKYHPSCMKIRNKKLVEMADFFVFAILNHNIKVELYKQLILQRVKD